jgi:hypothetical protein
VSRATNPAAIYAVGMRWGAPSVVDDEDRLLGRAFDQGAVDRFGEQSG